MNLPGGLLLVVCPGAFEVGWCDAAGPGSRLLCPTLLARALAGLSARLDLLGLVGVGGRWSHLSPRGWGSVGVPTRCLSQARLEAPNISVPVPGVDLCSGGSTGGV